MSRYTFTFYFFDATVQLKVWNRYGAIYDAYYPQTYTVQECLEDYCDALGWCLVSHDVAEHEHIGLHGEFHFVTMVDSATAVGGLW